MNRTVDQILEWAREQVKKFEWNLKHGSKFEQIQAKVKLSKIKSLTEDEFLEYATESYKTYQQQVSQ